MKKYILVLILLSAYCWAHSQVFQTNQTPYNWVRGGKFDSLAIIPRGCDTLALISPKWGQPTKGAIYFDTCNNAFYVRGSFGWVAVGLGDTTNFENVIDSTGNENYRVLYAKNGKITGESAFVYRDATNTLRLNYYSGSTNNFSIQAGDKVLINDSLLLPAIETHYDTANNKPTTIDANGVVKKMAYWPGGGGGSSTDNLDSVVHRGNWTTDSLNIKDSITGTNIASIYSISGGPFKFGQLRLSNTSNLSTNTLTSGGFELINTLGTGQNLRLRNSSVINGTNFLPDTANGNLSVGVKVNGNTYMAGSNGIADLGTIGGSGTVTSVGLTMPSAFSVSGSPVTSSGTLAVTGAGTTSQYIRGDGSLATYSLLNSDSLAIRRKGASLQHIVSFNSNSNGTAGTVNADSANIAIGILAGNAMTSGFSNVAIGSNALNANNTGGNNVAIGINSMLFNTNGNTNVSIGFESMRGNLGGGTNVAIGGTALRSNTSGDNNIAIGFSALRLNTTASQNVAIGRQALDANVTGTRGTAVGFNSLLLSTGSDNTAVGHSSMANNTSGTLNTAMGVNAGSAIGTGSANSFFGYLSGHVGGSNSRVSSTSIGAYSSRYDGGSYNVMVGAESGEGGVVGPITHTGNYNTGIGYRALYNQTTIRSGASNIAIGDRIDIPAPTSSNQVTIGSNGVNWLQRFTGGGWLVNYSGSAVTTQTASAALEINGTTGGLLIPRLTATQQNAISSPATGLLIFNTDSATHCFYNGSSWRKIGNQTWIDYSSASTIVGWSSFTSKQIRYMVVGKSITVNYYIEGTSDNATTTFTLPAAIGASGVTPLQGVAYGLNQGNSIIAQYSITGSTISFTRFNAIASVTGFNNTLTKRVAGSVTFETD